MDAAAILRGVGGLALLAIPVLQIALHRRLSAQGARSGGQRRLALANHACLAGAVVFCLVFCVPVGGNWTSGAALLLLAPVGAVTIFLWAMLAIRCRRLGGDEGLKSEVWTWRPQRAASETRQG